MPRRRFFAGEATFAVMAAADAGLGVAGLKSYTVVEGSLAFVVCLFDLRDGSLVATIAADRLGQIRTGAASGVAAKHLARSGATSLGLIGAGWQAESPLAASGPPCRRSPTSSSRDGRPSASRPSPSATARWSPRRRRTRAPVTSSSPPRRPATPCCAATGSWRARSSARSARTTRAPRQLDNLVLQRASLVCCDSLEDARLESGDLIEPVAAGNARLARGARAAPDRSRRAAGPSVGARHRRLQVERDRAVGRRPRARACGAGARPRGRRHASLKTISCAPSQRNLTPSGPEVLVALDDRREVVAGQLAGLRGEVDVAVGEQDLGFGDASGLEDDLTRVRIARRVLRSRGRGRGRRTGSSRPRPTSGRG